MEARPISKLQRTIRWGILGCARIAKRGLIMRLAVASRKNILVSGPTGSGKTTFTKALIREIPGNERLVTIEDAKELVLDRHPNHVRLFIPRTIRVSRA